MSGAAGRRGLKPPATVPTSDLATLVRRVTLQSLEVVELHAQRSDGVNPGAPLMAEGLGLVEGASPELLTLAAGRQAPGTLTFLVRMSHEYQRADAEPAARISVGVRVLYGLAAGEPLDDPSIRRLGHELALHHAWPFLRERLMTLAQSIGLTPSILPLHRR